MSRNSVEIRAESAGVLESCFRGLQADRSATILIEGHTSSEGTEEYTQRLSERRAGGRRGFHAARPR